MQIVIDIPKEVYKNIMNDHGVSPYGMVFNSIQNGTPIPENATNGEVIKAIFSSGKIWKSDSYMCLLIYGQGDAQMFDADWWNAPYQKGGSNEN